MKTVQLAMLAWAQLRNLRPSGRRCDRHWDYP